MAYQTKNNSGAIFLNDRKTQENQPDYTGKVIVDNKTYYVSCWVKEPNDPDKKSFLSLAFSVPKKAEPKQVGAASGKQPKQQTEEPPIEEEVMVDETPIEDDEPLPF